MSIKSTGPFDVPASENSILPLALNIYLENLSNHERTVTVIVEKANEAFFPNSSPESIIFNQVVPLPAHHSTKLVLFSSFFNPESFKTGDILNIKIEGTDLDLFLVQVSSILQDVSGHHIPSTLYRDSDFTFISSIV
ncbi:hypothetical protein COI93_10625 [Bacillus cereus]|uniref:Uncharacterized protein n=1 Tax=Bacillus cereus TaxID=1396 RepID=A0A2B0MQU4_BACCE|nr:hypothetical protein COI93_10625 [Bacillus cereus]